MNKQEILDHFDQEGYVVVRGLLDQSSDLQPIVDDYRRLLDRLAHQWVASGRLTSTFDELPFDRRFIKIIGQLGENWSQYFDISLPPEVNANTPLHLSKSVFNLLRNQQLLDVVELFIGSEIYSNPIQHVRIKPPQRMLSEDIRQNAMTGQTHWHQDQGAALPEADQTQILTVWLPLTNAEVENGCLQVIPGQHRHEMLTHCPVLTIPEALLKRSAVAVPMMPGDVLIMHRLTPHASVPNVSDRIRWSFDLRYHPVGQPTGRPLLPGFVARSRQHPETELKDYAQWLSLWQSAKTALIQHGPFQLHRWDGSEPICA